MSEFSEFLGAINSQGRRARTLRRLKDQYGLNIEVDGSSLSIKTDGGSFGNVVERVLTDDEFDKMAEKFVIDYLSYKKEEEAFRESNDRDNEYYENNKQRLDSAVDVLEQIIIKCGGNQRRIEQARTSFLRFLVDYDQQLSRRLRSDPSDVHPESSFSSGEAESTSLPSEPPSKWSSKLGMTPPQFIKVTYGQWLGNGLTRAHLMALDAPLYDALRAWLGTHQLPPDLGLAPGKPGPSSKETDSWVSRIREAEEKGEMITIPANTKFINRIARALHVQNKMDKS